MFDEIFGNDMPELPKKIFVPALPFDDQTGWQYQKPSEASLGKAITMQRDALSDEILGDVPSPADAFPVGHPAVEELNRMYTPDPVFTLANTIEQRQVDMMLKAGGRPGEKLRRMMEKDSCTLVEGMSKLVDNFKEFFSEDDKRLLHRAIRSLDLPGFFQLLNDRVYDANV